MKTQTLLRVLLLWASISCLSPLMAQTTYLSVYDSTRTSCHDDGEVYVYVGNGTAPYVYTLSPYYSGTLFNQITQTSSHFMGIPVGTYVLTVTDANGLSNSLQPAYVNVGGSFYAYTQVNPAICPATTGSEYIYVYNPGGTHSYTYQWSTGATTDSITNVPIGAHYSCTVTDVTTGCFTLSEDSGAMYQTSSIYGSFTSTTANCRNGTATVTGAGGTSPYTYVWSNAQATATRNNLSAGYYYVTITDALGCTANSGTYISQGIVISSTTNMTAEHCNDGNGTATVSPTNGSAPFTYLWSTGNTTSHITGLSAGGYSVNITDNNGCTANSYVSVSKSSPVVASATATQTLCTVNNGSVTVTASGGTTPYSYYWNSSPPQVTASATGLGAGSYNVTVTDAQGCIQHALATVTQSTTLSMSLQKTDPVCGGAPGSAIATVSGGSTPYTYAWNTGSTTASVTGVQQSTYESCTVTDAQGCIVTRYTYLESRSPIMLSLTTNNASCIYTADGSATMTAYGGLPPYTYHWPNGQTTATATGLLTGDYYGAVTDANGCSSYHCFHVGYNSILPCAVTISGTVYDDHAGDCINNGLDQGLTGVWVGCFPGGGYQWTNVGGYYNFVLAPGTYYLAQTPPLYHTVICPATPGNITLTAGQSSPNNNFFNQPDSITDLAINCIPYQQPKAGFVHHIKLFVKNLGTFTTSPDVVYMHSLAVTLQSSSPAPDVYDPATGRMEWNSLAMNANATNQIDLFFNIPSALATGYTLNNSDTVYPITGDTSIYNNYEDCIESVVRAYDPNYIDVMPKGLGTPGFIATKDSLLRYVIHFQNTGNAAATYVTLKTPIDSNLDISTFNFIGASHNVTSISADNSRILTIRFDNINLPDSGADRLGSQGFAAFTFKQKKGLVAGNTMSEQANIYFDFNTPVPTNTALNTIAYPASVREIKSGSLALYPNPTPGNVTLDLSSADESRVQVRVYDMMGRVTMEIPYGTLPASKKLTLQTSGLATGVYSIEVTGNASYVQKLVKTDK